MKYIKLFEGVVENRKITLELKKRLALLLVDYLNFFDLEAELSNVRVYCKLKNNTRGSINLTKSGNIMEIEWSYNDYFREELDILTDWLKEKNTINKPYMTINTSRIKTYMNIRVNEIDEFMNTIRELIDSGEIQLRRNANKYNV